MSFYKCILSGNGIGYKMTHNQHIDKSNNFSSFIDNKNNNNNLI